MPRTLMQGVKVRTWVLDRVVFCFQRLGLENRERCYSIARCTVAQGAVPSIAGLDLDQLCRSSLLKRSSRQ